MPGIDTDCLFFIYILKKIKETTNASSSSVALQPGVGLGLLFNTPPSLSIPCSVSLRNYSVEIYIY